MRRLLRILAAIASVVIVPPAAEAHKPSDSYLSLDATQTEIHGEWKIALRDLDHAIGLDGNDDGAITWGELRARHRDIAAYALSRLRIGLDGVACQMRAAQHLVDELSDGAYEVLRFTVDCPLVGRALTVGYDLFFELDPTHRGLLRVEARAGTHTAIFSPEARIRRFDVEHVAPLRQLIEYCRQGVWHIWVGYDHILFLLTLLLPAVLRRGNGTWSPVARFRDAFWHVAGIVTAFTAAHSITLSLAALGVVTLPSRLVESAIAASVVAAAVNNLYPVTTQRVWRLAFLFGLLHGFGFASVLADLGLPQDALVAALFGFNLGVELGQLAIVAAFLPFAYSLCRWHLYPRAVLHLGSTTVALVALLWFAERAFDVVIPVP
jgi:HupE / UreJ protein